MTLWSHVARVVGLQRAKIWAVTFIFILSTASLGLGAMHLLDSPQSAGVLDAPARARQLGDEDGDGLADVIENQIGSDYRKKDTLGHGVPDGWIFRWFGTGADWNNSNLLLAPALVPPLDSVPGPLRGQIALPTFLDVYRIDSANRSSTAWWISGTPMDPFQWDNDGDGIADAWLIQNGLRPWMVAADAQSPGDPRFTLREKYELGLDPTTDDSDHDGLPDWSEIEGKVVFGGQSYQFTPTSPRDFSSRGDGISDGFVVRIGERPDDVSVGLLAPIHEGLSVQEAFGETERACATELAARCDWAARLGSGNFVNPHVADSNDDGVPDAWMARVAWAYGSVLDNASAIVVDNSTSWDRQVWREGFEASLVVDALNPRPTRVYNTTLAQLYNFGKPPQWDENRLGPWWGGIPPNYNASQRSVPLSPALRGWNLSVDHCLGCLEASAPNSNNTRSAWADPRLEDSDQDGLSDLEEYLGNGTPGVIIRTDPLDPDTDGDGLSDWQERPGRLGTHPLRRDSVGRFLTDGEAYEYWSARHARALEEFTLQPQAAQIRYKHLASGGVVQLADLDKLLPLGSLSGNSTNLLTADNDGDGIRDGAELYPNLHLAMQTSLPRPATDPARRDTDGDGLPDAWEIRWSRTQDYGCSAPCRSPVQGFQGWPLNPARYNSFNPAATEIAPGSEPSDFHQNLKGEEIRVRPGQAPRQFHNGLAYEYDLDPYVRDSSPQDQIPDLFALVWGILEIPLEVRTLIDQSVAAGSSQHSWVKQAAERIASARPTEFTTPLSHAVMDPARAIPSVTLASNFGQMFQGREKGAWIYSSQPCSSKSSLPATGMRADGIANIPSRTLAPACWVWNGYPLRSDLENGTNPWSHDFDSDGLPDAWEYFYFPREADNPHPQQPTAASVSSGCMRETENRGLPIPSPTNAAGNCLTHLEAYQNGLDPTRADTDGGGLADWIEVALGLNPLNQDDDRGEEDWDGDGLLNRVEGILGTNRFSPDSDLDGLMDGDWLGLEQVSFVAPGLGGGDLCLRTGSDPVPLMQHRPPFLGPSDSGGPMNRSALLAWHRSMGLLVNEAPGSRCPLPVTEGDGKPHSYVLLKREVMLDRWSSTGSPVILGAGGGSNPLAWSTKGTGVPDGWLIHWRDSVVGNQNARLALDPTKAESATSNPDGDLLTIDEYRWARPNDWSESRDGTWWGGLNPVVRDTDGDEDWYRSVFNGMDTLDTDADADGIPDEIDSHPGIDHDNVGVIARNPQGGGYQTNFTLLWDNLKHRDRWDLKDQDGDFIPDALDRARIVVNAMFTNATGAALTSLSKSAGDFFWVTGRVSTNETALPGQVYVGDVTGSASGLNSSVGNVTVTVLISDGNFTAVAGANITDSQGRFVVRGSVAAVTSGPLLNFTTSIRGQTYAANSTALIQTRSAMLATGPISIWAMAEPNDPNRQRLNFSGLPSVAAFKDVDLGDTDPARGPETAPGVAPALRAVRLFEDRSGPNLNMTRVQHGAEAIAAGHSSPVSVDLRAGTLLTVTLDPPSPRQGVPFAITGKLTDLAGLPLAGKSISLQLANKEESANITLPTNSNGAFVHNQTTGGWPLGLFTVTANAQFSSGDRFLDPPPAAVVQSYLIQETRWVEPFLVGQQLLLDGAEVPMNPYAPLPIQLALRDVPHGNLVPSRPVRVTLTSPDVPLPILDIPATTNGGGMLMLSLPALPNNVPLGSLRLKMEVLPATPDDLPASATIFLVPHFDTALQISKDPLAQAVAAQPAVPNWPTNLHAIGKLGEQISVGGTLQRLAGGSPQSLVGNHGTIAVACPHQTQWVNSTTPGGKFQTHITGQNPGLVVCHVSFTPSPGVALLASPPQELRILVRAETSLRAEPIAGQVGHPVWINGTLDWAKGNPAPDQEIRARWSDSLDNVSATTRPDGSFSLQLPAKSTAGSVSAAIKFPGSAAFLESDAVAQGVVRAPVRLDVTVDNTTVDFQGGAIGAINSSLSAEGRSLVAHELMLVLRSPLGELRHVAASTDSGGRVSIPYQNLDLAQAGKWQALVSFNGSSLLLPARWEGSFEVTIEVKFQILSAPANLRGGDPIAVHGVTMAPNNVSSRIWFELLMDHVSFATLHTTTGTAWSVVAQTPALPLGQHQLGIRASAGQAVRVLGDAVNVTYRAPLDVHLEIVEGADGTRNVNVTLVTESGERVRERERVVLARQHEGKIIQVYRVELDAEGLAVLALSSQEAGNLTVLHLDRPQFWVSGVFVDSTLTPAGPGEKPFFGTKVLAALAASMLLLAVGIGWALIRWHSRGRRSIEAILREAHWRFQDPSVSPVDLIRQAYSRLLQALGAVGYRPTPDRTVRDILEDAGRGFNLPARPWRTISRLFEKAAFSTAKFGQAERQAAQRSFVEVADAIVRRQRRKP